MNAYETTATVEDNGQVHLAGVPFAPGTPVDVVIRETITAETAGARTVSVRDLFNRLHGRNTQPVGAFRREELYDRHVLR